MSRTVEVPLASALASHGIALAIVNPRQVRDFAHATGRLAKTDRLDAEVLARFGEAVAAVTRHPTGLRDIAGLLGQLQHPHLHPNYLLF